MKRLRRIQKIIAALAAVLLLQGCSSAGIQTAVNGSGAEAGGNMEPALTEPEEKQLESGLYTVYYGGEYGLDAFLEQGGASSDAQVVQFLTGYYGSQLPGVKTSGFGCSTLSVPSTEGGALFGRNFDWARCNALIVESAPKTGYKSISTVNLDFLGGYLQSFPVKARTLAALYAPLDGMNEKGLCVAVLMIQDSADIEQESGKPDLTTTTAVRLLLDKAGSVEEAVNLLEQYDLHASMDMMVHIALSDAAGNSVVVEYVNNEMTVTETPVVTNFYLSEGQKKGVGTAQSHKRYEALEKLAEENPEMTMEQLRDAMDSVSKDNYDEFESTEWTVIYNQSTGEVRYYHRENYEKSYTFQLGAGE